MTVTTFQTDNETVDGEYDVKSKTLKVSAIHNKNDTLYNKFTIGKKLGNGNQVTDIDASQVWVNNIPMSHKIFLKQYFDVNPTIVKKEIRN
jgi:hypothetical protein